MAERWPLSSYHKKENIKKIISDQVVGYSAREIQKIKSDPRFLDELNRESLRVMKNNEIKWAKGRYLAEVSEDGRLISSDGFVTRFSPAEAMMRFDQDRYNRIFKEALNNYKSRIKENEMNTKQPDSIGKTTAENLKTAEISDTKEKKDEENKNLEKVSSADAGKKLNEEALPPEEVMERVRAIEKVIGRPLTSESIKRIKESFESNFKPEVEVSQDKKIEPQSDQKSWSEKEILKERDDQVIGREENLNITREGIPEGELSVEGNLAVEVNSQRINALRQSTENLVKILSEENQKLTTLLGRKQNLAQIETSFQKLNELASSETIKAEHLIDFLVDLSKSIQLIGNSRAEELAKNDKKKLMAVSLGLENLSKNLADWKKEIALTGMAGNKKDVFKDAIVSIEDLAQYAREKSRYLKNISLK